MEVAAAGLGGRIELRSEGIETLADTGRYDLAWVAAPFMREAALTAGLPRVAASLRPGGWALVGLYRGEGEVGAALAVLRTVRAGGDVLEPSRIEEFLREAGLDEVQVVAPAAWLSGLFVAGRRAAS